MSPVGPLMILGVVGPCLGLPSLREPVHQVLPLLPEPGLKVFLSQGHSLLFIFSGQVHALPPTVVHHFLGLDAGGPLHSDLGDQTPVVTLLL